MSCLYEPGHGEPVADSLQARKPKCVDPERAQCRTHEATALRQRRDLNDINEPTVEFDAFDPLRRRAQRDRANGRLWRSVVQAHEDIVALHVKGRYLNTGLVYLKEAAPMNPVGGVSDSQLGEQRLTPACVFHWDAGLFPRAGVGQKRILDFLGSP